MFGNPHPTPLSVYSYLSAVRVCLDDRWTGILVLGKREGEVLGGCARLLQVHSASVGLCEACRAVRGAAKFVGFDLQINADKNKESFHPP